MLFINQSCGMQLEEKNEWVVLSARIDWGALEKLYASLFPSHKGHPAKPLRMALGALIIQKRKKLSDRALVKEIAENPYLQYFLGIQQYSHKCPFEATSLVAFRKRLSVSVHVGRRSAHLLTLVLFAFSFVRITPGASLQI